MTTQAAAPAASSPAPVVAQESKTNDALTNLETGAAFHVFRAFFGYCLDSFYSRIRIKDEHHVPERAPVIFLINHNSGLVDMLMMLAKCPRVPVRFWAAGFYWEMKPLAKIVNALKLVPVVRAHEAHRNKKLYDWPLANTDSNATFQYSLDLMKQNQCVALCPEGETHSRSEMIKLRTGTARMLIMALQQNLGRAVVMPCGLMYGERSKSQQPVVIEYGKPMTINEIVAAAELKGPVEMTEDAVHRITEVLQKEMRNVTVNAEDWPTVGALRTAAEIYQPDHHHLPLELEMEITQRFANKYVEISKKEPKIVQLLDNIKAYNAELKKRDIQDFHVRTQELTPLFWLKLLPLLVTTLIWLVPGLIGVPFHVPVYFLMNFLWSKLAKSPKIDERKLDGATVLQTFPHYLPGGVDLADGFKLFFGMVIVLIGYLGVLVFSTFRWGMLWTALLAVALPLVHFATLRALTRLIGKLHKLHVRTKLYFSMRNDVVALRKRRRELQIVVRTMVDEFGDKDLERIFPKHSLE